MIFLSVGIVALQCLACVGLGAVVIRVTMPNAGRDVGVATAFALGFGVLGWILFFFGVAGWFSKIPLALLLVAGAAGLVTWRRGSIVESPAKPALPFGTVDVILGVMIAVAMFFDLLEGLSPPVDADTLAYHFALPKHFLSAGHLIFVPRAIDGAIPLLVEMTYVPALALGGEKAMTLWTMVSGWAASALCYQIARRYLDRRWSMALALLLLTTPAVLYGAGSGQTEIRIAMFVLVAAFAVVDSLKSGRYGYAVIAGLAIGFFMASKYTGLLFAFACALPILAQRRGYRHFVTLAVIGAVAGGQWYVWNWLHTGDPVFPMLTGLPGFDYGPFWDAEHRIAFHTAVFEAERAVPINLFWLIAYPFVATFAGYPVFESGRTGFGPFVMLALPFAAFGLWRLRARLARSPLMAIVFIVAVFYALWFLTGSSQRVRHLLPVYPLLLICVGVAAARWTENSAGNIHSLAAAVVLTSVLQLAGQALFTWSYAKYLFSDETRNAFLERTVIGFAPVPWINAHLTSSDRIYFFERNLNYLLDVPAHYGHIAKDALIDLRLKASDPDKFWRQLTAQGITHLLISNAPPPDEKTTGPFLGYDLWRPLFARGCLTIVHQVASRQFGSRTLAADTPKIMTSLVLKLKNGDCPKIAKK